MTSKTIIVQIGNSDNKLTQQEWSRFVENVDRIITQNADEIHFHACSEGSKPWQNACWVFDIQPNYMVDTLNELNYSRREFEQDSISWTEGETIFIKD